MAKFFCLIFSSQSGNAHVEHQFQTGSYNIMYFQSESFCTYSLQSTSETATIRKMCVRMPMVHVFDLACWVLILA